MAQALLPGNDPEPPDNECVYPEMRYEMPRVKTLADLASRALPARVHLTKLASGGFFRTKEGLIVCYDCGLHYGLGHHCKCKADVCNVPLRLTKAKMEEEMDGFQAAAGAMQGGLLKPRSHVHIKVPTHPAAAVQPSCGGMDLSHVHSVNSRRRERRRNPFEQAGFKIVRRNSVRCPDCGVEIELEMLTPLKDSTSLHHILQKHADLAPTCHARPTLS